MVILGCTELFRVLIALFTRDLIVQGNLWGDNGEVGTLPRFLLGEKRSGLRYLFAKRFAKSFYTSKEG